MRGRTNVGSGGGYIINGIKKECTVSGLPITKGDFVNVYNEPDGYLYLNTSDVPLAMGKITDELYMFCNASMVFVANISTKTILKSANLQKEYNIAAPPAYLGNGEMVYIDARTTYYNTNQSTGFKLLALNRKVSYDIESNNFTFSSGNNWVTIDSSSSASFLPGGVNFGVVSNVSNGKVTFGIRYYTNVSRHSIFILLNNNSITSFNGNFGNDIYPTGVQISGNSICASVFINYSSDNTRFASKVTRFVVSGSSVVSQESVSIDNEYVVPITFCDSQWQGLKVDALVDNNNNQSAILWKGLQNIGSATAEIGIIPKYYALYNLSQGNFLLTNNIIKLNDSYVLYEHRTVDGNNVLSMMAFDSSGYHKVELDVTEYTALTSCRAAAEYYESTNTFSLVYRGAYNSTDDPSNLLVRFMNTQMKDLNGGTNIVSLASDFRYIRGVANAYGEDGDTIQVIVSSLDTMEAITHDIQEERTSFVIENDHLILEQEEYDPYQYSINDNGHLTVI